MDLTWTLPALRAKMEAVELGVQAMKLRTIFMLSALATALSATAANAAVTVLTSGEAESCYQAAENGWDASEYIPICNFALNTYLSPRDRAATLVNRGILKLSRVDGDGSLDDFNKGLKIDASIAEGYVDRGASLILLKRFDEALAEINKGMAMHSKKPEVAFFDRAMAYEGLGNVQAAYEDYKQAQLIDPYFDEPTQELKRFKVVTKPAGT
jgi:tetratricopeptide (TPR) repeat protein